MSTTATITTSTTLNNSKTIDLSERPKLYDQMRARPYELNPLNTKELFIYLEGVKKEKYLSFKYYSEFLNILNTLIFFYLICHYNAESNQMNTIIFLSVDSLSIVFCLLNFFLNSNKQSKHSKFTLWIVFIIFFVFSQLLEQFSHSKSKNYFLIHKYYKLNYIIISIGFLFAYDYYANPNYSSIITRSLYMLLAVILSTQTNSNEQKIRIFIYSFEFFEFIPELRKFLSSYSPTHNFLCYLLNFIWYAALLIVLGKKAYLVRILTWNVLIINFYPQLFQYYYNNYEILIRGLWDLPNVTSYM